MSDATNRRLRAPANDRHPADQGDSDDRAWLYGELDIDPDSPDGNPYWDQDAHDHAAARNALMARFRSGDISGDEYRARAADLEQQRRQQLQGPDSLTASSMRTPHG